MGSTALDLAHQRGSEELAALFTTGGMSTERPSPQTLQHMSVGAAESGVLAAQQFIQQAIQRSHLGTSAAARHVSTIARAPDDRFRCRSFNVAAQELQQQQNFQAAVKFIAPASLTKNQTSSELANSQKLLAESQAQLAAAHSEIEKLKKLVESATLVGKTPLTIAGMKQVLSNQGSATKEGVDREFDRLDTNKVHSMACAAQ